MLSRIQQDVRQRMPDLARRPHDPLVEALQDHGPPSSDDPPDGPRNARADRLHPTPERARILRLYQEMDVIPLHGVRDEPEPVPHPRLAQRALELAHEPHGAERGNAPPDAEGEKRGMMSGAGGPRCVAHMSRTPRLASRADSPPAPSEGGLQIERELSGSLHCV